MPQKCLDNGASLQQISSPSCFLRSPNKTHVYKKTPHYIATPSSA